MRSRRWVAALILIAAVVPALGARADDANHACDDDGVTVVVDFQELGGGVNVRCAPQPVTSGFDALRRAAISYDQYQGFVCRIAGKPEEGPCDRYPPANAYWAYWTATPGGQWVYSKFGAGSRKPAAGSYDGWSFSKDRGSGDPAPPRYPVPAAPATTTPDTTPSPDTSDAPPASTLTTRTVAPTSTSTSGPVTSVVDLVTTTTRDTDATTTTRVALGTVDLSSDGGGSGTSGGFLASIGAVALLGAAGFFIVRRRG